MIVKKNDIGKDKTSEQHGTEKTVFSASTSKQINIEGNNTLMLSVVETQPNDAIIPETQEEVFPEMDDDGQVGSISLSMSSMNVSDPESLNAERKNSNRKIAYSDVSVQKAILDSLHQGHFEINVQDGQNTMQSSSSS